MKQIKTVGIVLSRTNYAEADKIITVITPDNGKVRLLARGVRKIKSKLAGGIELFCISDVSFIVGRGELRTLTSTRLQKNYDKIQTDITRTLFGYDVLKIINRVTEDESGEDFYELLDKVLEAINNLDVRLDIVRFWFYLQLLRLEGHSPNLKDDTKQIPQAENKKYSFDIEKMGFVLSSSGSYRSGHIKLLRLGLSLKSPIKLQNINNLDKTLPSCLELVTIMLRQYTRL